MTQSIWLDGVASKQVLLQTSRHLAILLAEQMASNGLVWQEVTVQLQTESGTVTRSVRLSCHRSPESLYLPVNLLISQADIPAPVDSLVITVAGLALAPLEQLSLFSDPCSARRFRLYQAVREVNSRYPLALARAASVEIDRREKMLSFYDPLRQVVKASAQTAPSNL